MSEFASLKLVSKNYMTVKHFESVKIKFDFELIFIKAFDLINIRNHTMPASYSIVI